MNLGTIRADLYGEGAQEIIYIPESAEMSLGSSLETKARLLCDGTKRPQGLVRRARPLAKTATIRFDLVGVKESLEFLPQIIDLCGKKCNITFGSMALPAMVCTAAQATPAIDAVNIFAAVSVALEFTEIYTKRETAQTAVRAFKDRSWENRAISEF